MTRGEVLLAGRMWIAKSAYNLPHRRLARIDKLQLNRGHPDNADDGGLLAALLHPVVVRGVGDAAHEAALPEGAGTVFSGSNASPEFTHQVPEMTKHSRSVT